jgi:autotransporter passenger strand-loop-strand repeat protein
MSTYTLSAGTVISVTSGSPTGQYIVEGGTLAIGSGGVTSGVQVKTGVENVLAGGQANGNIVSGGLETIHSGGIASGAVVSGKGRQVLLRGGRSIADVIKKGGQEVVNAGGIASSSVVSNGGKLVIDGGAHASGLKVLNSGTVDLAGGIFTGTIANGGIEAVTSAANHRVYKGLKVSNGVTLTVSSGGKTSGTTIEASGVEIVGRGGAESHVSVMSGGEIVFAGGTAAVATYSGSTIGLASGTRINGRTIGNGVTLVVSSGASANSTSLGTGATEIVEIGGSIGGTTRMGAQSTLDVVKTTANVTSLTVSGFGKNNTIELAAFTQAQPSWQYTPMVGSPTPQGVLSITAESHTTSIHLFGQYVAAGFRINDIAQNVYITYSPPVAEVGADIAAGHHLTGR